jgi:hypothetical protein
MRSRRALLPVALATGVLGLLLTPVPAFAAGGTVYVDDDWTGTTPGADPDGAGPATAFGTDAFASVVDAVATSPDRVEIASGDYPGQLVLVDDVELVGAGEGTTFLSAPASPAGYTMYWGQNGILVVDGADVVVSGVTIRGPQNGVAFMVGALVGGGGSLELDSSTVRAIRDDPFGGAQRGNAVVAGASGGATTGSMTLRDVLVTDYQKTGVIIRPGSTALIEDSTIQGRGAQCVNGSNGVQLQGTATIRRTSVLDNRYADATSTPGCSGGNADSFGIGVFSPTGPTVIEDSTVSGNELGIYLSAGAGSGPALTITGTTVTGLLDDPVGNPLADASYGIYSAWERAGAVLSGNTVRRAEVGIELAGGTEDVTGNAVRDNTTGIVLDANPLRLAANAIVGNGTGLEATDVASSGPNWWGCDEGPGQAGCDDVSGDYAEPSWLVLSLEVSACQLAEDEDVAAVARLTTTSAGTAYADATVPPTAVTFTTNGLVSILPGSGTTVDGELPVLVHGVDPGAATADAHADSGLASAPGGSCAQLTVLAAEVPLLPATGADEGAAAWAAGTLAAGLALVLAAGLARAHERRLRRDYARRDG